VVRTKYLTKIRVNFHLQKIQKDPAVHCAVRTKYLTKIRVNFRLQKIKKDPAVHCAVRTKYLTKIRVNFRLQKIQKDTAVHCAVRTKYLTTILVNFRLQKIQKDPTVHCAVRTKYLTTIRVNFRLQKIQKTRLCTSIPTKTLATDCSTSKYNSESRYCNRSIKIGCFLKLYFSFGRTALWSPTTKFITFVLISIQVKRNTDFRKPSCVFMLRLT